MPIGYLGGEGGGRFRDDGMRIVTLNRAQSG